MTNEEFKQAIKDKKIMPYDEEFLSRLRNELYMGIPVSLIVLNFNICNSNCYPVAINLTRGMDKFKLVYGDINIYPKLDYPNHSWVEKDNYVYDPTDGFIYDKDFYYKLYQPKVYKSYDESNIQSNKYYHEVMDNIPLNNNLSSILEMMIQEENNKPTINHSLLLSEIEKVKKLYIAKAKI